MITDRPLGTFEVLHEQKNFKLKILDVKPNESISLQYHRHIAEHWVVVEGTALVQIGNEEFTLKPNESTYIPVGSVHRLSNPGRIPLRIIEVQSGSYIAEDDIVRLEDIYGRLKTPEELDEEK